jgi:formylglycine-generating enzyme required for sulfatase activity
MRRFAVSLTLLVSAGCARLAGLDELAVTSGNEAGSDGTSDVSAPCEADAGPVSCPTGMVAIPGGCYYQRLESRAVTVSTFCLDVHEVSLGEYRACAEAGKCLAVDDTVTRELGTTDEVWQVYNSLCNARLGRLDHPMNCVNGLAAAAYCASIGARLPSSDEWDWAAHGGPANGDNPWGDGPVAGRPCWAGATTLEHDGTCARGASVDVSLQGVHDLAGNVSEWTSTRPGSGVRMACGASFASADPLALTRCGGISEVLRKNVLGFRCAR